MLMTAIPDVVFAIDMVIIYSPDGTNIYGSRGVEFEQIGSL